MPILERGTHRLHYEVRGQESAPPVLLIMGLSFSSRAWHTLPARLAERFFVITFDNAGSGRSTAPRRLSMAQMADDAAALLDELGVAHTSVFGISMGGMIAIELALRHTRRLKRLILGCTHGGYLKSHKPNAGTMFMLGAAMLFSKRLSPARLARFLTSDEHYARDRQGFIAWLSETDATDPLSSMRQMRAIMGHRADERLAELDVPTLILSGDRDLLVPVENSRRLASAIRGSRLIEFPGAGHCFPVECEDEVVSAIQEFCLS